MPAATTRELLDHVRHFHHQVGEFYDSLREKTTRRRVKLLLDYLHYHQKKLEQALDVFDAVADKDVMETWFQYTPPEDFMDELIQTASPELEFQQVLAIATRIDEEVTQFYRHLADMAPIPKMRELFTDLARNLADAKRQLIRDALSLDM